MAFTDLDLHEIKLSYHVENVSVQYVWQNNDFYNKIYRISERISSKPHEMLPIFQNVSIFSFNIL